jgi:hypothetical protein
MLITLVALCVWGAVGCETLGSSGIGDALKGVLGDEGKGELRLETIVAGLKEALKVGTDRTVASTSRAGGYLNNPGIRIALPEQLSGMASALRAAGMGEQVDRLELKMNESAEQAAVSAAPVFLEAIGTMSFGDARKILEGGDNAATDFFKKNSSDSLRAKYRPIVTAKMGELGVIKTYQDLERSYQRIPFAPKTSFSVEDHVTEKALDGLFSILGDEEKKIRQDPAARSTDLLKRVFGGK